MQSSGRRVRLARNMLGLSRKELEEKFHLSVNTLQAWEGNKNILTNKGARKLNEIFIKLGLLCSEDWLLTGIGENPILLQDTTPLPTEMSEDFSILREIETFKSLNPDSIAVIVNDNGMEPIYSLGDFVGGNKRGDERIANLIGENCIIETSHGDTLVRRLLKGSHSHLYNLACLNIKTDQQPIILDIKINFAARIVLHRRKEIS